MGLFSSILHVRDVIRDDLLATLTGILHESGFARTESLRVTADGPFALPDHDAAGSAGPYYLVSPLYEHWLTII